MAQNLYYSLGVFFILFIILPSITKILYNNSLEKNYQKAVYALNDGEYELALDLFNNHIDYRDSVVLVLAVKYGMAYDLLNDEAFGEARNIFAELGAYSDSANMVKECDYEQACILTEAGEYDLALSMFEALGDYQDSARHISGIQYIPVAEKATHDRTKGVFSGLLVGIDIYCEYSPLECTFTQILEIPEYGLLGLISNFVSSVSGEPVEYNDEEGLSSVAEELFYQYFYPEGCTDIICVVEVRDYANDGYVQGSFDGRSLATITEPQDFDEQYGQQKIDPDIAVPYSQQEIIINSTGSTATLTLRTWENGSWIDVFSTNAYIGSNGVSYTKTEGDRCTPAGTFDVLFAFGTDMPKTNLEFHSIGPNDVWVCDENSAYYNTLKNNQSYEKDWNSVEDLYSKFMNNRSYACIYFAFNGDGESAYSASFLGGSDLFIDGVGSAGNLTSGYGDIKISAADMRVLLEHLDSSMNPVVIIS